MLERFGVMTAKQQVTEILNNLPDNCSLEDIQYQLYVVEKIRRRIDQADRGPLISQAEAQERLNKWLIK